jgi:hypothetical protein
VAEGRAAEQRCGRAEPEWWVASKEEMAKRRPEVDPRLGLDMWCQRDGSHLRATQFSLFTLILMSFVVFTYN